MRGEVASSSGCRLHCGLPGPPLPTPALPWSGPRAHAALAVGLWGKSGQGVAGPTVGGAAGSEAQAGAWGGLPAARMGRGTGGPRWARWGRQHLVNEDGSEGCSDAARIALPAHLASRGAAAGGTGGSPSGADSSRLARRRVGRAAGGWWAAPSQLGTPPPSSPIAGTGCRGGPSPGTGSTVPATSPGIWVSGLGGYPAKCCRGGGRSPATSWALPGGSAVSGSGGDPYL